MDLSLDPLQLLSSTSKANAINRIPKKHKTFQPTKVRSCSWKRSEKEISTPNSLANKKTKSLRKKSPRWLKLSNGAVKLCEKTTFIKTNEETSLCRPGTLYSDALLCGAGSSSLVKVKNLTPRRCNNNAKKKLNKVVFKYSENDKFISDKSEIDGERNKYPSLRKVKNKIYSPSVNTRVPRSESIEKSSAIEKTRSKFGTLVIESTILSVSPPTKAEDIVTLPERNDFPSLINKSSFKDCSDQPFELSNGNSYKASSSQNIGESNTATSYSKKSEQSSINTFMLAIPKWNFTNTDDTSFETFPHFLGQFDDENYLKAEKIALLGLKLALGNNSQYNFKI